LPPEPTDQKPVEAGAELRPARVRPGEQLTLVVQVKIAPTWHIYPAEGSPGTGVPTTLTLKLPEGVEPAGPWTYPKATPVPGGQGLVHEGTVTFRRPLRVSGRAAAGPVRVECVLGFQACDPFSCRPPATLGLRAGADIVANP
jgi:DsbC/DsbD-like thiol-disulfide interchange protein